MKRGGALNERVIEFLASVHDPAASPIGIEMLMRQLTRFCVLIGCIAAGWGEQSTAVRGGEHDESRFTIDEAAAAGRPGRTRSFQFHYRFDVSSLEPDQIVRIWMPVPDSSTDQEVTPLPYQLPVEPSFHTEPRFDNRILYLETVAPASGELSLDVPYRVQRREILATQTGDQDNRALPRRQRELYLQATTKVPIDGRPLELLRGLELSNDAFEVARQLYELVDRHVSYSKAGTGWGNGDVLWVCDSRYGNCTDFHSLFISLARSRGVPSRFEIGFPIPSDAGQGAVAGYHCWAHFFTEERGWVPVDISEADKHPSLREYYFGSLTPDRITFSTGRDIELAPRSASGPLNYFIFPHVEVDGARLPREQIALKFSYADLPE